MLKSLNTLMVLMVSVLISTPVLMNSINTSDSLNTITQTTTIPSRSVIEDQFLSFKLVNCDNSNRMRCMHEINMICK